MAEQTYYRWRNQFWGLKAQDAKRLKELERENATLKRLLADAELEKDALIEDPDKALRDWLRVYAGQHPRWGHRRAYHDARVAGWTVNHKKVQRLWRDEGLRVHVKRRRKDAGSIPDAGVWHVPGLRYPAIPFTPWR